MITVQLVGEGKHNAVEVLVMEEMGIALEMPWCTGGNERNTRRGGGGPLLSPICCGRIPCLACSRCVPSGVLLLPLVPRFALLYITSPFPSMLLMLLTCFVRQILDHVFMLYRF
jgi:hypothetical protein